MTDRELPDLPFCEPAKPLVRIYSAEQTRRYGEQCYRQAMQSKWIKYSEQKPTEHRPYLCLVMLDGGIFKPQVFDGPPIYEWNWSGVAYYQPVPIPPPKETRHD